MNILRKELGIIDYIAKFPTRNRDFFLVENISPRKLKSIGFIKSKSNCSSLLEELGFEFNENQSVVCITRKKKIKVYTKHNGNYLKEI